MSRCNVCGVDIDALGCNCSVIDSDCFTVGGDGSDDAPFTVSPKLDPDVDNLLVCTPGAGLKAELPALIANPPACRVYHSADQSLATATDVTLAFNSERFDTDTMHDNSTNNSRITFTHAGVYAITLGVTWEGAIGGDRKIRLRLNGATILVSDERSSDQADDFDHSTGTIYKAAAGDYVEAWLGQNSGVTLKIKANGNYSPEMAAVRIGVG